MSLFAPSPSIWTSRMLSLLRIVTGFSFLIHGTMKMFNYPLGQQPMPPFNPMTQLGVAGMLEVFGGVLIIIGLLTRPVAFLLAGEMAVAYFQVHFPRSFFPTINGGESPVLFCFIYLYFMMAGAGPWSVDAAIARSRAGRATI